MRIRDWINRGVGLGLLISLLLCAAGAALGTILMAFSGVVGREVDGIHVVAGIICWL